MPSKHEAIRNEAQDSFIQFLNVELKLGSTFVQSAVLAHGEDHEHAKDSAILAAETVERFKSHIVKVKARNEIGRRLTSLKKMLATL
jgi:hypothetical protein